MGAIDWNSLYDNFNRCSLAEQMLFWGRHLERSDWPVTNFYIACRKDVLESLLPEIMIHLGLDFETAITLDARGYDHDLRGLISEKVGLDSLSQNPASDIPIILEGFADNLAYGQAEIHFEDIARFAHDWDQGIGEEKKHSGPDLFLEKLRAAKKRLVMFTWVDAGHPHYEEAIRSICQSHFKAGLIEPVMPEIP